MLLNQSRYLGVQPFKTVNKRIFFGRDDDIRKLYDYILLVKQLVLFGKSGYGKSSLLSAGIIPKLIDSTVEPEDRFEPIEVNFKNYVEGKTLAPIETLHELIKTLPNTEGGAFLVKNDFEDTLWLALKQRQGLCDGQFVLIFDQFEELFTYPTNQIEAFKKQLAELLNSNIPQSVRSKMDDFSDDEQSFLSKKMNIKAVFAIREDRYGLLDSLRDALPNILKETYELKALTSEQAKQAIQIPASLKDDDTIQFSTPPFEYTEGAINTIIKALTTTEVDGKESVVTGVEAFQLQIVCEHVETLIKKGSIDDIDGNDMPDITEKHLPKMSNLYEGYYHRKLGELEDPSVRETASRILEEGLLTQGKTIAEVKRMSVDSRALQKDYLADRADNKLLEKLAKTYLVRSEPNTVGGFNIEISHDTLVEPILAARIKRLAPQEAKERDLETVEVFWQDAKKWFAESGENYKKEAIKYLELGIEILAKYDDFEQRLTDFHIAIIDCYLLMRQSSKALERIDATLTHVKHDISKARLLVKKAQYSVIENLTKSRLNAETNAYNYYLAAIELYRNHQQEMEVASLLEHLARLDEQKKDYDSAFQKFEEALSLYGKHNCLIEYFRVEFDYQRLSSLKEAEAEQNRTWGYMQNLSTGETSPFKGLDEAYIGRDAGNVVNTINIPVQLVSRRHLLIRRNQTIEDLRSLNGTFVNAERLPYAVAQKLNNGDIIVLSSQVFFRYSLEEPSPLNLLNNAWAIFINGRAKSYTFLTEPNYSLNFKPPLGSNGQKYGYLELNAGKDAQALLHFNKESSLLSFNNPNSLWDLIYTMRNIQNVERDTEFLDYIVDKNKGMPLEYGLAFTFVTLNQERFITEVGSNFQIIRFV